MSAEPISRLSQAIEITGQVIAGVSADQWTSPTPCPDWNAAALVTHLVVGNIGFAAIVSGKPRPATPDVAPAATDLPGAYRDASAALVAAFSQPGVLDQIVSSPIGEIPGSAALHLRVIETLTHGWDLATATGQVIAVPDELAEPEIAFSLAALAKLPQDRKPFASAQQAQPGASAFERLLACLGRDASAGR